MPGVMPIYLILAGGWATSVSSYLRNLDPVVSCGPFIWMHPLMRCILHALALPVGRVAACIPEGDPSF
jgi:hypothetical protein